MGAVTPIAQIPWEFDQLLHIVGEPSAVLEIGVWHGGTLAHWLRLANLVVAIDDQMLHEADWHEWAAVHGTGLLTHRGKSSDAASIALADSVAPYDLIFIDADHSYDAARADWENYGRMLRAGGMVAFHDILPRENHGVHRLWEELKYGRRTIEIRAVEPAEFADDPRCGIGIVCT